MKSFVQYITEAGVKTSKGFVKGWTLKNKIHISTTNFDDYHIKQVVNKSSKFGLNERKILKIISDAHPDADHADELHSYELPEKGSLELIDEEYINNQFMQQQQRMPNR